MHKQPETILRKASKTRWPDLPPSSLRRSPQKENAEMLKCRPGAPPGGVMRSALCGRSYPQGALESVRARFGDLLVLLHSPGAHPDGAQDLPVTHQRDATREDNEATAVRFAQAEDRTLWPGYLLQVRRLLLEGDSGVGLVDGDSDAADERAVHPDVGLEVAARIHDRYVHRLPDLPSLLLGRGDNLPRLLQRYGLPGLRGFHSLSPFVHDFPADPNILMCRAAVSFTLSPT